MMNVEKRVWGGDDFFGPKHLFRQKKMISLLRKKIKRGSILDAGCGKGDLSFALLKKEFSIIAVDVTDENLDFLKNKIQRLGLNSRIKLIKSELEELNLEKECLDGIVCGEVLEHVKDDHKALRNFNFFLKKGGHCIITVPVNKRFWNIDDVWAGHYRRYSLKSFNELVEKNGFKIEKMRFYGPFFNFYFFNVYLPILKKRLKNEENKKPTKKNFLVTNFKKFTSFFYWVFYIDDVFRYPPERSIYLLADIKKVREV